MSLPTTAFAPGEAASYLLAAGLLTAAEVVNHGIRIEPGYGRNLILRAVRRDGSGWFLKMAPRGASDSGAALAREGAFYERIQRDPSWRALRAVVPQPTLFDPAAQVLVLELVPDVGNVHELDDDAETAACAPIGRLIGEALAACHNAPPGDWPTTTLGGERMPWVFDIASPTPEWLTDLSPAQLKVLSAVQADRAVCDALRALRSDWTVAALTHGDVKWGNVLAKVRGGGTAPTQIWLADWECAFVGDPAWDVGSAFHSFLADVVHNVTAAARSPADASRVFAELLPSAQREIGEAWRAYLAARGLNGPDAEALLGRAVRACGSRLVQSAFEWSPGTDAVPRGAVAALQLAAGILRAPEVARRDLLALPSLPGPRA